MNKAEKRLWAELKRHFDAIIKALKALEEYEKEIEKQ